MSNRTFGLSLIVLACIHQLVGLYEFHGELFDAILLGWWNSQVRNEPMRAVMLWFFVSGFLIMLWGESMRLRQGPIRTREWAGGALLSLAGATAIPVSGFWLVLAACLARGWQQRHDSMTGCVESTDVVSQ